MLGWTATLTALLTTADHWSTYLCLRAPVLGFEVMEANPVADWLFQSVGLVPGLLVDSLVTLVAIVFLMTTTQLSLGVKNSFLGVVCLATSYAVINNLVAMSDLGISPLGWS
jgi:hypothetical protein